MELEAQPSHIRGKKAPPLTTAERESPFERGYVSMGAAGAPLFELNSVEISGSLLQQISSISAGAVCIHGYIILIDDLANQFSLFSRKQSDPLLVNLHNSSLLKIERDKLGDARCLSGTFWLDFQLKFKGDQDAVEFNEYMFFDFTTDVLYDRLQQSSVSAPNLQVSVHYMIFRCAVLARPGFVVEKCHDDDKDDSDLEINGSIDLRYQMSDLSWMTQRMFFGNIQKLELGDFIEGPTLAAPAYSTLFFALDLGVNGENFRCVDHTLNFDDNIARGISYEKQVQGRKYLIRLILYRAIVIDELPENCLREFCDADRGTSLTKTMKNPYNKRPRGSRRQRNILLNDQPFYIQPHLQSLNNQYWVVTRGHEELVEIFSIYICSYDAQSSPLKLKGNILGYDIKRELDLFKGGMVHSGDIVELPTFDRCFIGWYFGIQINLEDDDGREICNGYAAYNAHNVGSWFNRRICSIMRGKCGYAAVHYSIFEDAVEAKLKFKLESKFRSTRGEYQVYGKISTRYNNVRYATHYEKKYYESRLFEKRDSEAMMLEYDDEIPLSKSAVAVPLKASLIVVGNINVMLKGRHLDSFQFEEIFPSEKPHLLNMIVGRGQKVDGSKFSLLVHVDWGYSFAQS